MNNDPIYVTFEFNGNLGEEVNRVKLGIAGLGDESSKTYQRLLSDSNGEFNAMNANNRRLAVSIQEDIRSLRQLSAASEALDQSYQSGRVSADEYVQAKARLTKQEDDLREGIRAQTDTLNE